MLWTDGLLLLSNPDGVYQLPRIACNLSTAEVIGQSNKQPAHGPVSSHCRSGEVREGSRRERDADVFSTLQRRVTTVFKVGAATGLNEPLPVERNSDAQLHLT